MAFKGYLESAKLKAKQFQERRALKKIYKEKKQAIAETKLEAKLGRLEKIEKKRANIRRLQQKHIPKRQQYLSPQATAAGLGGPSIFSFGEPQPPQNVLPRTKTTKQKSALPQFKEPESTSMLPSFDLGPGTLDLGFGLRKRKKRK